MRRFAGLMLVAGCVPGIPAPTHYSAIGPAPTYDRPMGEATVTPIALPPSIAAAYTAPLTAQPYLMPEIQGQLGPTHASAAPALWIVTRPGQDGGHFGVRVGGAVGTGDVLGVFDFYMPYAGPTLHVQFADRFANRATFAATLGGELLLPLIVDGLTETYTDSNGNIVGVVPSPVVWVGADVRGDLPVGDHAWLVIGGGFDFGMALWPIVSPNLTLGLRF